MTPPICLELVIAPALTQVPPDMATVEARAMLVAIALQESRLAYRRQRHGGPARSYWQFERGGIAGVLTHESTGQLALQLCDRLDVESTVGGVYEAIEFHDVLACLFARLLLWTSPNALPTRDQAEHGWSEYLSTWRPGRPHKGTWNEHFTRAWAHVAG